MGLKNSGGSLAQQSYSGETKDVALADGLAMVALEASREGIILLKNENVLPLKHNEAVALFGRVYRDYFCVGYGSGGDVNAPYKKSVSDALASRNYNLNGKLMQIYASWCDKNPVSHGFWGHWPTCYNEMPISQEVIKSLKRENEKAIVFIGRSAGEDRENKLEKGSFYLTDSEIDLLNMVSSFYDNIIVVLNIGNPIDFSWIKKYPSIKGLLYAPCCGQESGEAVCDVLWGEVNPSAKLTDTIAEKYDDYPSARDFGNPDYNNYTEDVYVGYRYFETFAREKVMYPFGFGLSYTNFQIDAKIAFDNQKVIISADVLNIGECTGKEVIQVYYEAPQGKLGKPLRSLIAFKKTALLAPNHKEHIQLTVRLSDMASFDDSGVTGNRDCYVLEEGVYKFYIGNNVRDAAFVAETVFKETIVVKKCEPICSIQVPFKVIKPEFIDGQIKVTRNTVYVNNRNLKARICDNEPIEITQKHGVHYNLNDVKNGKISLDDFISCLSVKELDSLCRGNTVMNSKYGALGNAGTFGGNTKSLRQKGVVSITTTDGPSGIRLRAKASLIPSGIALASSWNVELVEKLTQLLGNEMAMKGSDILLAPGMNIHRNHLCGRNFEYYSEDPYLTGRIAAAYVKGIQKNGLSACPKHFACNHQEVNRNRNDSRVSQRALREIYLKGFEICIKESKPKTIMTSYNKINGVWSHYNYDLCETVLRREWGYDGLVMTDWWMRDSKDPDFKGNYNSGYRIKSGVDLLMPGSKFINRFKKDKSALFSYRKKGLTLAQLQRSAKRVLEFIINSNRI